MKSVGALYLDLVSLDKWFLLAHSLSETVSNNVFHTCHVLLLLNFYLTCSHVFIHSAFNWKISV